MQVKQWLFLLSPIKVLKERKITIYATVTLKYSEWTYFENLKLKAVRGSKCGEDLGEQLKY